MSPDITLNASPGSFPPAGHYSHSTTAGGFVFISGQLPVTQDGEKKPMRLLKNKPDWPYKMSMPAWQVLESRVSTWFQYASMSRILTSGRHLTGSMVSGSVIFALPVLSLALPNFITVLP